MAAHARLKNEFTEDEKYHNVMRWLKCDLISVWYGYRNISGEARPYSAESCCPWPTAYGLYTADPDKETDLDDMNFSQWLT